MKVVTNFLLFILFSVIAFSCDNNSVIEYKLPDKEIIVPINIMVDSIKVDGDLGNFKVEKKLDIPEKDIQIITFTFTAKSPSELKPVSLKFSYPSIDINGFWNPSISSDKVNYYSSRIVSKTSRYAPVLSYYNNSLDNRITIALSDALNKVEISNYLMEEDVSFYPEIKLFTEKMPLTTSYTVKLRIDTRKLPYYEALGNVVDWWGEQDSYAPMHVPDAAKQPMYSTWYSYHQGISREEIVEECKIAKSLGCEAVIVDDGWQTLDGNRGYAYTGDWFPERITDMKEFVQDVHMEGMKFMLWYSLPFIGEKANNYPRFKGKYLKYWEAQGTYVLDPRYPEVRKFIVNTYVQALNDWNLDGFKLDFIGWFTANDKTELTAKNGRDYASVNVATDVLMTEIMQRLTTINPDILIEFRQPYIGPLMRKYGNMFRGVDCPNNAVANRLETTNLRMLSQNTAVHSDMFIWRSEEPVESAALQILNILYSVPQLSVRLGEIPEHHLSMIRFWFDFWKTNRNVLLDGDFKPSNPGANYPILTSVKDNHQITTVYEDIVVTVEQEITKLNIINAKGSTEVVVDFKSSKTGRITIYDCSGNICLEKEMNFAKGVIKLELPVSGMMLFE